MLLQTYRYTPTIDGNHGFIIIFKAQRTAVVSHSHVWVFLVWIMYTSPYSFYRYLSSVFLTRNLSIFLSLSQLLCMLQSFDGIE
jgi:hypothetical protein